jgi:hypothetical protein
MYNRRPRGPAGLTDYGRRQRRELIELSQRPADDRASASIATPKEDKPAEAPVAEPVIEQPVVRQPKVIEPEPEPQLIEPVRPLPPPRDESRLDACVNASAPKGPPPPGPSTKKEKVVMSFVPNLPTVITVMADKGGVGKTTLSRVMLDYFKAQGIDTKPFDTESPKGVLKRFFPAAEIVNLRDSNDQIKVFDSISRQHVTLIDMRAGLLTDTLDLINEIGLLDMGRNGKVNLAFMHIIGSTIASFNEIDAAADVLAGLNHYLVLNRTSTAEFFKSIDSVGKEALQRGTAILDIPMLDPVATEHVEAASVPFGDFEKDPQYSFVMRGKVRAWLAKVYAQLDKAQFNVH